MTDLIILRERLKRITDNGDLKSHPILLDMLSREISNSIRISDSGFPIDRYTCIVHALNLIENPDYVRIAGLGLGRVFAGTDFVNFLLTKGYLEEISLEDVSEGDLIIYFDNGQVTHAGKMIRDNRVISKWGRGYLYEHSIWEMPQQYGNNVRYFKGIKRETALQHFIEYAEQEGIIST